MLQQIQEQIRDAAARGVSLNIQGQGSKAFYGQDPVGEPLELAGFSGVTSYEPSELVVTAKAGTSIAELEQLLAGQGQHLAFEPPRFGGGTVGGMVASGLSGPARASMGALRDHVLGVTMLNGQAEALSFGGTVMKNVAGYDVSRLIAGSMGMLGVILEVSLKVLPLPTAQATLRFEMGAQKALDQLNLWGGQPLPINASACWDGALVLRLAGANAAVQAATQRLGGELIDEALARPFWDGLRDHSDEFFLGALRAEARRVSPLYRRRSHRAHKPRQLLAKCLCPSGCRHRRRRRAETLLDLPCPLRGLDFFSSKRLVALLLRAGDGALRAVFLGRCSPRARRRKII